MKSDPVGSCQPPVGAEVAPAAAVLSGYLDLGPPHPKRASGPDPRGYQGFIAENAVIYCSER